MSKLIVDCKSGETTERELNKAEKDQQKIDEVEVAKIDAEAQARAQAKAAAQSKLAALGLTTDDLKALGL
jgi:hypothetical protein